LPFLSIHYLVYLIYLELQQLILLFRDQVLQCYGDDDEHVPRGNDDEILRFVQICMMGHGIRILRCECELHSCGGDAHESLPELELDNGQQHDLQQLQEMYGELHDKQVLELVLLPHELHQLHNQF